jgi:hypothetical protein
LSRLRFMDLAVLHVILQASCTLTSQGGSLAQREVRLDQIAVAGGRLSA